MSNNINKNNTKDELNTKVRVIAIQFVTIARLEYPKLKAEAQSVHLSDWLVEALGGKNLKNYAKIDVIMKIAQEQGVDAIWPGWGHASDDPKLPNTLDRLGIKLIVPTSHVCAGRQDNRENPGKVVQSKHWSDSVDGPTNHGHLQTNLNAEGTISTKIFEKATAHTAKEGIASTKMIWSENGSTIKASDGCEGGELMFPHGENSSMIMASEGSDSFYLDADGKKQMAYFGGDSPPPVSVGYVVILGFGLFFLIFTTIVVYVDKAFSKNETITSEEFK
jgi:hypothetical protein